MPSGIRKSTGLPPHQGTKFTNEHKANMSNAKLGRTYSAEHKANMSKAHKQRSYDIHVIMKSKQITWQQACRIYKEQSQ